MPATGSATFSQKIQLRRAAKERNRAAGDHAPAGFAAQLIDGSSRPASVGGDALTPRQRAGTAAGARCRPALAPSTTNKRGDSTASSSSPAGLPPPKRWAGWCAAGYQDVADALAESGRCKQARRRKSPSVTIPIRARPWRPSYADAAEGGLAVMFRIASDISAFSSTNGTSWIRMRIRSQTRSSISQPGRRGCLEIVGRENLCARAALPPRRRPAPASWWWTVGA